jgi:hypothetical protein
LLSLLWRLALRPRPPRSPPHAGLGHLAAAPETVVAHPRVGALSMTMAAVVVTSRECRPSRRGRHLSDELPS